jgi:glycosyltransferase involved in cell wall biosynthesis
MRRSAPPLSVILPSRNAAAYLPDCIASIKAQSFVEFEVIAVDDGSTDETGALLEDWRAADARVQLLRTAAEGLVPALRRGLAAARGERMARMDADDVAHPERFTRQMRLLDAEPLAACGTLVRYFPRDRLKDGALAYERWVNSVVTPAQIERDMFVECALPHPTLMIRREALRSVGGYRDCGWPEDYDLLLRLWAARQRVGKVSDVLLSWRESEHRLSRTDARYHEGAFRACKVHHLRRTLLRHDPEIVVCGAGPVGKAFARALHSAGLRIRSFVELNPRKIGQMIHGAPVVHYDNIGDPKGAFAIAAVAGEMARAEIRATLQALGWTEMRDFCAVA